MAENHGHAQEAAVSFTVLALIGASVAFVVSMAHGSPARDVAIAQQAAPAIQPIANAGGGSPKLRAAPARRISTKRFRLARLMPLRRVSDPRRLGFQWPVAGFHGITSPFGPRDGGFHHGTDVGCGIGQRIYSSRAGRVAGVGDAGPAYGLAIMIDHGSGYQTVYAHLSKLEVQPGQYVRSRQEIARCGETGNASGPHVHFEMRYGGFVWDPVRFMP
jgi:murein DD-endopeptidase MepM/ murein hydrolase activator NlpD